MVVRPVRIGSRKRTPAAKRVALAGEGDSDSIGTLGMRVRGGKE